MLFFFVYASQREMSLSHKHRRICKFSLTVLPILQISPACKGEVNWFSFAFDIWSLLEATFLVHTPPRLLLVIGGREGGFFFLGIEQWKSVQKAFADETPFFFSIPVLDRNVQVCFPVLKVCKWAILPFSLKMEFIKILKRCTMQQRNFLFQIQKAFWKQKGNSGRQQRMTNSFEKTEQKTNWEI